MKKIALATALVCAAGVAHAAEQPEWNQLGVAYQTLDVDGESLNGFGLSGSALISEQVFVIGAFTRASDDVAIGSETLEFDIDTSSLGLGFRHPLSATTDLFATVSYVNQELTLSLMGESGSEDDSGYGFTGGFRSMVTESFEIGGSLGYVTIDDESETTVSIGADYYLTPSIAVGAAHSIADDVDTTSVGVTLVF